MNIKEAFAIIQKDSSLWARPKGWFSDALTIKDETIVEVPNINGDLPWIPGLKDILKEWEVVNCKDVCAELEQMNLSTSNEDLQKRINQMPHLQCN